MRSSWGLRLRILAGVAGVAALGCAAPEPEPSEPQAELPTVDLAGGPAFPLNGHLEQTDITAGSMSFDELMAAGDALFHTPYNSFDGVGAMRLADGTPIVRFVSFPPGGGTGAPISSQSCGSCHVGTASGLAHTNVAGDPDSDGAPPFNVRSTTSLLGNGFMQLLAQEITEDLQAVREQAAAQARQSPGTTVEAELTSKGIEYGTIVVTASADGEVTFDLSRVEGVDPDLVVRPMGWKGHVTTLRSNNVGAAAGLLGMQAEELVWRIPAGAESSDPDGDGVERELSVGDVTALVVYDAAQEVPSSVERMAELGVVTPPSEQDRARLERGREAFAQVGCHSCHKPELHLENTVFEEPTMRGNGNYYDLFLAAREEVAYDPERPFSFNLMELAEEPRPEPHPDGGALLRLYGDLKRHNMGRQLADPGGPQRSFTPALAPLEHDDEMVLIGPSVFLTPELWGVGSTSPWLHDGRAASLEEAIMWHGEDDPPPPGDATRSEAQESRDAYAALTAEEQEALVTFLRSLRTSERR